MSARQTPMIRIRLGNCGTYIAALHIDVPRPPPVTYTKLTSSHDLFEKGSHRLSERRSFIMLDVYT